MLLDTTIGQMHKFPYQDIIRLDVRMHNVNFAKETERQENLMSISAYGTNVEPNVFAKSLDNVSKIHAERKRKVKNSNRNRNHHWS